MIQRFHPAFDMDKWFDGMPASFFGQGSFMPAIDVYQTENDVVVKTPLAGVDPEKVSISVENDVLTIEGTSEEKTEVDDKEYYRKEIRSGSFHRSVALPVAVNGDKAKAVFEKGMLVITIPKEERAKPKTIKVEVSKDN